MLPDSANGTSQHKLPNREGNRMTKNQATLIDETMEGCPVLLTINQTCEVLNIGRTSFYRLVERGELDAVRITLSADDKTSTRITNESVSNLLLKWSTQIVGVAKSFRGKQDD